MISKRLETIAGLVPSCSCAADIGTDHGYVPIALAKRRDIEKVIGLDLRKGPLEKAKKNIENEGLAGKIELRLSDGAAMLADAEADVIVISGMGGSLISRIIKDRPGVFNAAARLILSPQSEIDRFRKDILEEGYLIEDEIILKEDGKYYFIILSCFAPEKTGPYSEEELAYGRAGLNKRDGVLKEYIKKDIDLANEVLGRLNGLKGDSAGKKRAECEKKIKTALSALDHYREQGVEK